MSGLAFHTGLLRGTKQGSVIGDSMAGQGTARNDKQQAGTGGATSKLKFFFVNEREVINDRRFDGGTGTARKNKIQQKGRGEGERGNCRDFGTAWQRQ